MTAALTPSEALARLPAFAAAEVEAELHGLTNRSFRLRLGDDRFVLRLDAPHTRSIPLDRAMEKRAQDRAAALGLAPDVVIADPDDGIWITRYVAGRPARREDFANTRFLDSLAGLLRAVHALEPLGQALGMIEAAEAYAGAVDGDAGHRKIASRCLRIIERWRAPSRLSCCHNDVVAENLIVSDTLVLLDWEYAADNDPLFDLATPVAYHELDDREADGLLSAYLGRVTPDDRERLSELIRVADALHWLWLARRQRFSPKAQLRARLDRLATRLGVGGPAR